MVAGPSEPRAPTLLPATEPSDAAPPAGLELPSAGDVDRFVQCHRNAFLVTARGGDISPAGARELGLFHDDTRHLSYFALEIEGSTPIRLGGSVREGAAAQFDLMLSDLEFGGLLEDPQNFLHIRRTQILHDGLAEQTTLTNFLHRPIDLVVRFHFAADFADVFEVRGARRLRRGQLLPATLQSDQVVLRYAGLDGISYGTELRFEPAPARLAADVAEFRVALGPGEVSSLVVTVTPQRSDLPDREPAPSSFPDRMTRARSGAALFAARATSFACDHGLIQSFLERAIDDLGALRVEVSGHPIVAAGIPWFCAPFGRDALITSIASLAVIPQLAVESLFALAAFQGHRDDPVRDEEPGKILHELRRGEMVRTGELPHSPYYGSIDATPLWIVCLDETFLWTGDLAMVRRLRPHLDHALAWLDARTAEGSRFLTYARRHPDGLDNQGWKDSRAGVSFPSGEFAVPPVALVEVQGYVFDAYRRAGHLLRALGDPVRAALLDTRAHRLRALVEAELWLNKQGRYAMALDGQGRKLDTIASNAGHLLWSELPSPQRARRTADLLLSPRCFSGYGVRTVADEQPVYNPLSYHNGTVWPHDNALLAAGMARYGLGAQALTVFDALFAAMHAFRDHRLPELFCGMDREIGNALVPYPVSCSPQAWSSAAVFLLLQAILGLHPDAPAGTLSIRNPRLPDAVRHLTIRRMRVGNSTVSMRLRRVGRACHVDQLDVEGSPLKVIIEMEPSGAPR